jgi:hypothetical protein
MPSYQLSKCPIQSIDITPKTIDKIKLSSEQKKLSSDQKLSSDYESIDEETRVFFNKFNKVIGDSMIEAWDVYKKGQVEIFKGLWLKGDEKGRYKHIIEENGKKRFAVGCAVTKIIKIDMSDTSGEVKKKIDLLKYNDFVYWLQNSEVKKTNNLLARKSYYEYLKEGNVFLKSDLVARLMYDSDFFTNLKENNHLAIVYMEFPVDSDIAVNPNFLSNTLEHIFGFFDRFSLTGGYLGYALRNIPGIKHVLDSLFSIMFYVDRTGVSYASSSFNKNHFSGIMVFQPYSNIREVCDYVINGCEVDDELCNEVVIR